MEFKLTILPEYEEEEEEEEVRAFLGFGLMTTDESANSIFDKYIGVGIGCNPNLLSTRTSIKS